MLTPVQKTDVCLCEPGELVLQLAASRVRAERGQGVPQEKDGYLRELEELVPQLEAALAERAAAEAAARSASAGGGAELASAQAAARVRPSAYALHSYLQSSEAWEL